MTVSSIDVSSLLMAKPRLPAAELAEVLLQAERQTKTNRQEFPLESLLGVWQLAFVTSGKINSKSLRKRGFYVPGFVPATLTFSHNEADTEFEAPLTIANQVKVGSICLRLEGPARYQSKKNILAFDFIKITVEVLGKRVYSGKFPSPREGKSFMEIPLGKLPFFAFFHMDEAWVAARGRGGGLALWQKQDS
jgi:hypothetical protein